MDFRTRGGLCKHGLAAALFLLQAGHELPEVAAWLGGGMHQEIAPAGE